MKRKKFEPVLVGPYDMYRVIDVTEIKYLVSKIFIFYS